MANDIQPLCDSNTKAQPMEPETVVGLDESELDEVIPTGGGGLDFDEWTSLILETEKKYPEDIDKICLVYDSFLSEFPLCHGYWRKYAAHKARLCTVDETVDVFERAVQSATYSLSVWVDYCSFSITAFEDSSDIRRLFRRAISIVGKDYLSYSLWDKYIEFELSQQQWDSLALIYIQILRFPTKKLHYYYSSFKKLTASLKENIQSETGSNPSKPMESEDFPDAEIPICYTDTEISSVINDLLDLSTGMARYSALQKYMHTGEKLYDEACQLEQKIVPFECKIGRTYFHVKQLDASQLKNWHCYLDFVEVHEDFDWAVKLYERCLIPCANYPEFWMRYVELMEIKGGRELAKFALERATKTFLKKVPAIHLFNARYKEKLGDLSGGRAAFSQLDVDLDSNFAEIITLKANMEKRMGNFTAASNVYKEALEMALVKKKLHVLPNLYIHFSRLKYKIKRSVDAAMEVLIDGIKNVPHCKLLFKELLNFVMMHGGPKRINLVDSIVAAAISVKQDVSQGWSEQDKEDISALHLKVVDLWGTIDDVNKVWNRHVKLFPHTIRPMSYEDPASGTETLRMTKGGKQATVTSGPNWQIKDGGPDLSTQISLVDNKQSPLENKDLENKDFHPDQTDSVKEAASHLLENRHIDMKESTTDQVHSGEAVISAKDMVQQNSPKIYEPSGEDGSEVELAREPIDNSKEEEYDHALGQNLKNLSLRHEESDENEALPRMSHEEKAPLATSMSNESDCNTNGGAVMHNPLVVGSSGSIQIPSEVASPSSSASHGKPIYIQAPIQSQMPATGNEKWHRKRNSGNLHRDSENQFHGHSQRRPHQKWQDSPRQHQGIKLGPQLPDDQDYTSESFASKKLPVEQNSQEHNQIQAAPSYDNPTMPLAWAAQQQHFPATGPSQFPPLDFTVTPEKSQNIAPSEEQYGHTQSGQAPQTYDQMWQYYYYQQQQQYHLQQQQLQQSQFLQQHYHQQQLQMQQNYFQSQQLYPFQHLQLQQQYYSQQQQQQALQATYHQQQQILQHQHSLGLQPQVSQTDQLLLQQPEHQPEELEEEEQRQHKKQVSSLPIQMRTINHDQLDSWQNSGSSQSGAEPGQTNEVSVDIEATPSHT